VRIWASRQRVLVPLHYSFVAVMLAALVGFGWVGREPFLSWPVLSQIVIAILATVVYSVLVFRIARCPNCDLYPGRRGRSGEPKHVGAARDRGIHDWTACWKCDADLH
jgi:hypothetical protein